MWSVWRGEEGEEVRDRIGMEEVKSAFGGYLQDEFFLCKAGLSGGASWSLVRPGWSGMEVQLGKAQCELVVLPVAKVWEIGGMRMAILGMLDKYVPLASISRLWTSMLVHCLRLC